MPKHPTLPDRIEWPTVAVAVAIGGGLVALSILHKGLPWPILLGAFGVLGAWYNSLQHEVIHGHPTSWRKLNLTIAAVPLGLVVPFWMYRDSHLAHHRDEHLTDPLSDPESFYVTQETWDRTAAVRRWCLLARRTLLGRMMLGPFVTAHRAICALRRATPWRQLRFALGVIGVIAVVQASGMPIWIYVIGVGYVGQAISLLRSFVEHRAVADGPPTAVIHVGRLWRLLFLNNTLHLTHHRAPHVAWFDLPAAHRALGLDDEAANGAGLYFGYTGIIRRYAVRPFCQPVHPGHDALRSEP